MEMDSRVRLVAFDLFGTLVRFGVMHHPFRKILRFARENGRKPSPYDARDLMSIDCGPEEALSRLGILPPRELVEKLIQEIREELDSLTLFEEIISVLDLLTKRGVRLAICSNLASAYGPVIDRLLPQYDFIRCLSYEVGAIKPEAKMYDEIVKKSGVDSNHTLFVGDTYIADFVGPTQYGFRAFHLQRAGASHLRSIESLSEIIDLLPTI